MSQINESVLPTEKNFQVFNSDKEILSVLGNGTLVTTNPTTGLTVNLSASAGWTTDPTGTLTRTTFISDSVTLPVLAAHVAALIVDLRAKGLLIP